MEFIRSFYSGVGDFLAVGRMAWKRLLLVYVVATVLACIIGFFIPFVNARNFGIGTGLVITFLLWILGYLGMRNSNM
jgi:hypothetical protein